MRSLLIIILTLFSFGSFAIAVNKDIPVKKRKAVSAENIFAFYAVSLQAADYEVAEYFESIQVILAKDFKLDGAPSENAIYNGFEMLIDNRDFETAEYIHSK